jgi:hypothetical protein
MRLEAGSVIKGMAMRIWAAMVPLMILGGGMNACAMGSSASWREEVELHDGRKIVVERAQTRGGRHEIGQEIPVAEHIMSFKHPDTGKSITWKSEYGIEVDKWSLLPLALDVVNGAPYIVTTPAGCIAYNKWQRPNPPYVVQKLDGKVWQRVELSAFPAVIREANLVTDALSGRTEHRLTTGRSGPVSAAEVQNINTEALDPAVQYVRVFVREPLKPGAVGVSCEELVYYKGAWVAPGDSIGRRMMDRMSK